MVYVREGILRCFFPTNLFKVTISVFRNNFTVKIMSFSQSGYVIKQTKCKQIKFTQLLSMLKWVIPYLKSRTV